MYEGRYTLPCRGVVATNRAKAFFIARFLFLLKCCPTLGFLSMCGMLATHTLLHGNVFLPYFTNVILDKWGLCREYCSTLVVRHGLRGPAVEVECVGQVQPEDGDTVEYCQTEQRQACTRRE